MSQIQLGIRRIQTQTSDMRRPCLPPSHSRGTSYNYLFNLEKRNSAYDIWWENDGGRKRD